MVWPWTTEEEKKDELNPGFLTEKFSSPWWSIPYALGSGMAAAASPATARLSQVANMGLRMGMGAEKEAYEQNKRKKLSQVVGQLGSITTPTQVKRTGLDPAIKTTYELPDQHLSTALSAPGGIEQVDVTGQAPMTPQPMIPQGPSENVAPARPLPAYTEQRPLFAPALQKYLQLRGAVDPEGALKIADEYISRQPKSPHFATTDTGEIIAINPENVEDVRTVRPGTRPLSYEEAARDIPANLPMGTKATVQFGKGGTLSREGPKEDTKEPPSLDDNLVDQGLAELSAGRPLSRRVMSGLGTDDAEVAKNTLLMRNQIRQERKAKEKQDAIDIALVGKSAELSMQPMQGMTLDAATGEVVNITKGDYAQNPKSFIRLTAGQERMKGGLDTASTHMIVTSKFIEKVPKSGLRITNFLRQKISQLENDPNAIALFQQLGSMTSLAVGSALVAGGGGRPGVRLAEFMGPSGITEGDTLAVAVTKMQSWMEIVSRNAKEAGLPSFPYEHATKQMNFNIRMGLIKDAKGDINVAKKNAEALGLKLN